MSVSLRGNLDDFGISEIFQLVGQQRKTGVLELRGSDAVVQIVFRQGCVVCADPLDADPESTYAEWLVRCGILTQEVAERVLRECRSQLQSVAARCSALGLAAAAELSEIRALLTRETVFGVLSWRAGHFDFRAQEVSVPEGVETLAAEQILMEGMRVLDESQRAADLSASRDLVFRATGDLVALRRELPGDSAAARVFQRIDGRNNAQRCIDLTRLGSFEGMRALAELQRCGLIEAVASRRDRVMLRAAPPRPKGRIVARVASTWIPIALLCAALSVAQDRVKAVRVARDPSAAWPARERIESGLALRGTRHALEACRLATGNYPEQIEGLAQRGCLPDGSLASPDGAPYYSMARDGEVLLLAPAHSPR
jgi:hypothetical protein